MSALFLAQLGPIIFGIDAAAYTEAKRKSEYRWAKMERLGVRPARQWIGIGDDSLTLRGVVYPQIGVGRWRIEDMRDAAQQGIPYDFVDGTGHVWGKYCITSVEETQSLFVPGGGPRRQEFEISLEEYGEDELQPTLAGGPATGVGSGLS